ncbi:isochorismatase family protein [Coraliomargarita parva]|uniref:isochorismatase family protein n=1 Tax=Coraliomargarita parva TaxID=3014050 RepID=UPI0022B5A17E|nr:isochorismatase family protein [Coraliomargarita parva]
MKAALLIVDVQNDFLPGGALAAPEGDSILPAINSLVQRFDIVLASQDWHPEQTAHFDKWPVHCVRDTPGAALSPALDSAQITHLLHKGTGTQDDGYSAFEATNIDLDAYLKTLGITKLYICGIATDYCVMNTVLDACKAGYESYVVEDAVKGIELKDGDIARAYESMEAAGAQRIRSGEIKL